MFCCASRPLEGTTSIHVTVTGRVFRFDSKLQVTMPTTIFPWHFATRDTRTWSGRSHSKRGVEKGRRESGCFFFCVSDRYVPKPQGSDGTVQSRAQEYVCAVKENKHFHDTC